MPLPFLAADRDFGTTASDVALPHAGTDHWRRPYRLGPQRVAISALALLLAAYLLISALIIAIAGTVGAAGVTLLLAACVIAFALRVLRMGIWVSPRGLRRVGLLSTKTLRWREIERVSTVQQPVRWLGLPRTVQGQAVHIEPRRGEPLAPLLTDHSADFLTRAEAFARASDVLEAWASEHRH
ncbi:hypothetical protein N0X72_23135 [Streptomyces carpaticus]|uniref:Membrane protein n=1 Tax=Streptomyces cheonanensis TaxID=312720 RepID=A0ABN2VH88_9ACTN|nr:hypothetical protein N0X72_23135 [Streptomyces carpaticus]